MKFVLAEKPEEAIIGKLQNSVGRNLKIFMTVSKSEIIINVNEPLTLTEKSVVQSRLVELFPNMRIIAEEEKIG